MRRNLLLTAATVAILGAGSFVSIGAQAASRTTEAAKSGKAAAVHHRDRTARSDITSFSSSSAPPALNVGVNHPSKK